MATLEGVSLGARSVIPPTPLPVCSAWMAATSPLANVRDAPMVATCAPVVVSAQSAHPTST